jgi:RNA polymerase sigma-70 factor, ECF subfamily
VRPPPGTVARVERASGVPVRPDPESLEWIRALKSRGATRDEAISRLHALLVRAARFEAGRRAPRFSHLRGGDLGDIVQQSADDALVAVLARLDDYRGASRFTTWAYKFALLETAVRLRRLAWQGREVPLAAPEGWERMADPAAAPDERAERSELLAEIRRGMERALTPAPAGRARGARPQRGADRRPRRAPRDQPGGALQDPARRPETPAGGPRPRRAGRSRSTGEELMDPREHDPERALLGPEAREVGCDECFAQIDRWVELERAGADADRRLPGLRAHLEGCPACAEEAASLAALLDEDGP